MKAPYVARYSRSGFTLIEMIMVITIMALVGVLISVIASRQMEGYIGMSRRAALVASGGAIITYLERDIRNALPNSIRISGSVMELVPVVQTLRYREANSTAAGSDPLDFSTADTQFQLLGTLSALPNNARLVIYNSNLVSGSVPLAGFNVYGNASAGPIPPSGAHVITPATTVLGITPDASGDFISLTPGHQFSFSSPQKRMYIVTTALSYRCDTSAGTMTRYRNYPLQTTQPTTVAQFSASGASSGLVAAKISYCRFDYQAGTAQQTALVTVQIRLEEAGEHVDLLHQIHVDNAI